MLSVPIFIIGIMQILKITITPTKPTAFFKTTPHPSTLSTTSPRTFPTTGITVETAAFAVLAVIPSTLLLKVPSNDTIPTNICNNNTSFLEHEATVSKINEEQLFYLMSRGLTKKEATQMIIMGFIEPFSKELPMEYAVELNQLIKMDMEGSIG